MNTDFYEERKGYFVVSRTHPITGKPLRKKGSDKLVLALWVEHIESVRSRYSAGLMSEEDVLKTLGLGEGERLTVAEAWDAYFPLMKSAGTRRAYSASWEKRLKKQLGALHCSELTETKMRDWETKQLAEVTSKGTRVQGVTVAHAFNVLRACLMLQVRTGKLSRLPWGAWTMRVSKHKLERETLADTSEMARLIRAAAEVDAANQGDGRGGKFGDLSIRLLVLLFTGLRQGELGALGWDDLTMARGGNPEIRIRHAVTRDWHKTHPTWDRPLDPPKGGKVAVIPIHEDVILALQTQRENLRKMGPCLACGALLYAPCAAGCSAVVRGWYRPNGPVFPSKAGKWRTHPRTVSPERLRELVREALPEVDASRFVVHSLRHSFASASLVGTGGDVRKTMQLTRHDSPQVFQKYTHAVGRSPARIPMASLGLEFGGARPARLPAKLQVVADEREELDPHTVILGLEEGEDDGDEGASAEESSEPAARSFVASILAATPERAAEFEERRATEREAAQRQIKNRYRASNITDFSTAWDDWTARGRPGKRPHQVTAAMQSAQDRERRKGYRESAEQGRHTVKSGENSWTKIARVVLGIGAGEDTPSGAEEELRSCNGGAQRPPPAGNIVRTPARWEGSRRGRIAAKRVLGAWETFKRRKDAEAQAAQGGATGSLAQASQDLTVDDPDPDEDGDDP